MTFRDFYYSFPTLHELPYLVPPALLWRQRATAAILRQLSLLEYVQGNILEIGCGSGFLSRKIANLFTDNYVYGIDASAPMISYARMRCREENLRFLRLNFLDIASSPLGRTRFGAIVSLNVWPLLPLEPSLQLVRQISEEGTAFVAVTYCRTAWSRFHRRVLSPLFGSSLHIYEPGEFISALSRLGFEGTYSSIDRLEGTYLVSSVRAR